MATTGFRARCVDPYGVHKKKITSNLRPVTAADIVRNPSLKIGDFLCNNCRTKYSSSEPVTSVGTSDTAGTDESKVSDLEKEIIPDDYLIQQSSQTTCPTAADDCSGEQDCSAIEIPLFNISPEIFSSPPSSGNSSEKCVFYDAKYDCSKGKKQILEINADERSLMSWNSGVWTFESSNVICENHYQIYVVAYLPTRKPMKTDVCCDPFQSHKSDVKSDIRKITLVGMMKARDRGVSLVAGEMMCKNCRQNVLQLPLLSSSPKELSQESQGSSVLSVSLQKEEVDHTFQFLGLSPLEHGLYSKIGRINEGKRKLESAAEIVRKKVCYALDLRPEDLNAEESKSVDEFKRLMEAVREKIKTASKAEKYQLLTLCPLSWQVSEAAKYFGVSRYYIQQGRTLRLEKGILSKPSFTRSTKIASDVYEKVVQFYCEDINSKILPGQRDCISIGWNKHEQKRILRFDLRELYDNFTIKHPDIKIGWSIFCSLRPKWCILAGQPGSQRICVCQIHENVKLILYALGIKEHYKTLIPSFVCDINARTCLLGLCDNCCTFDIIHSVLRGSVCSQIQLLADTSQEDADQELSDFLEEEVEFKQWVSTDRTELTTRLVMRSELIEIATKQFRNLIPHNFIAQDQSNYLKDAKTNLDPSRVIAVMDFSMNYSCVLQGEVQSYHWSKKQVTVHPVVVYSKMVDGSLSETNLCFISDDLTHDVNLVSKFQEETINYVKKNLPIVTHIEYVSDGCAAQYKNKRSFFNLCQHKETYGLSASLTFFATSHGKSTCDAIGGTVKRKTRRASLKGRIEDQITDAKKMFDFCISSGMQSKITFLFVHKKDVDVEREYARNNPVTLFSVPGTRTFHNFLPMSGETVGCKKLSSDQELSLVHCLVKRQALQANFATGDFVVIKLSRRKYIAFVTDINQQEGEVEVSLLSPPFPSEKFKWPKEIKSAIAAPTDILSQVNIVECEKNDYSLSKEECERLRRL